MSTLRSFWGVLRYRRGIEMVSLSRISKLYFGNAKVLDQVNLELKKGEFLYLIGGSGAGKSSLLRILATEEAPSEGTISLAPAADARFWT